MIALLGKSASGKTTIFNVLVEKYNYKPIVSYTTRNPRQGEMDGIDYYFITEDEFIHKLHQGFFAESVNNYGKRYGIAKEDCKDDSIVIVEKHGLEQLRKIDSLNIKAFYINVSSIERFKRIFKRGDDSFKAIRRILVDNRKFKGVQEMCDHSVNNIDVKKCCEEIQLLLTLKSFNGIIKQMATRNIES